MLHADVTDRVIAAATKVHTALGAGLLESAYDACLMYQMTCDGLRFEHQLRLPVVYREVRLDIGYRVDFLVENSVIVEVKAVEKLLAVHTAQVLSYLKLSGRQVGLLVNFNVPHLRQGLRRVIHGYSVPEGNNLPASNDDPTE
jgi:GxxExxY protein